MAQEKSVLNKIWNVFGNVGGVLSIASIAQDIIAWEPFIENIISGYRELVRPFFSWFPDLFNFPEWTSDYLFLGVLVITPKITAVAKYMKGHWKVSMENTNWYIIWAPHRVSLILLFIISVVLWPIFIFLYLPQKYPQEDHIQLKIQKEQYKRFIILLILLVGLTILNEVFKHFLN